MKVSVESRTQDFHAHCEDDRRMWGAEDPEEAIGNAVCAHSATLGLRIQTILPDGQGHTVGAAIDNTRISVIIRSDGKQYHASAQGTELTSSSSSFYGALGSVLRSNAETLGITIDIETN